MVARVEFQEWVLPQGDARRLPRFLVLRDEEYWLPVSVVLTRTRAAMLTAALNIDDLDENSPEIDEAMLRFGVRRIRQAIQDRIFPSEPTTTIFPLYVEDADLPLLTNFVKSKTCDYQVSDGRDLFCSAAGPSDDYVVGRMELRRLAPTSRPICKACDLPNTDYICAHFVHPEVIGSGAMGGLYARQLSAAICDAGRSEIRDPERCRPGQNPCWSSSIEPESLLPVQPVAPDALPQALDFLDVAWRLAFGKDQPLLHLQTATNVAGLTLGCSSRAELEARVSDISDVVKSFAIPDALLPEDKRGTIRQDHTLARLRECLKPRLEEADYEVVERHLEVLRGISRIRAGYQHSGAGSDLLRAFESLGVSLPSENWGETWEIVRSRVTAALRGLAETVRLIAISEHPKG